MAVVRKVKVAATTRSVDFQHVTSKDDQTGIVTVYDFLRQPDVS